ncbi:MAG: metallophosphoesterase [Candidatus Caldatribacteriota bacterium]|nr:metallophosphoesterase [Candidatus Caldatribacteriota bacterium]
MRKTSLLVLAIIILSLIFLCGIFSVYATIYRIIDTEGNTIRVTTEPQMKKSEEEAGCILSPIQPDIVLPISKDISQVKGIVFEDRNVNGIQDIGEVGLPDILVSNGLTVTITDETGSYFLPREGDFIFITTPSNYISTTSWYKNLLEDNLYFGLKFAPDKDSKQFTFVQITDIHLDAVEEHRIFFEEAVREINKINPAFVIATGDLVLEAERVTISQAKEWYDIYSGLISTFNIPVFNMVGNHDVVGIRCKKDISTEPGYNKEMYRDYFGPTYYSFDWGSYHCIVLDPNEFLDGNQFYRIPNYQVEWLRKDLSYRQGEPLLVFFHEPTITWEDRTEVLNLLNQHSTKMFSGHWHLDALIDSQGIPEQVTGALCGEWWRGDCMDGSPCGYRLIQVDEENIFSFYKGIGIERQINITSPEPLIYGETIVTAQVYTEYPPLQEVRYQVDQGDVIPMKIEKGSLWDITTAIWDTTSIEEGYHTITIKAKDQEELFSQQIEVKVSQSEIMPLGELVPHFETYQGHLMNVQGRISFSFKNKDNTSERKDVLVIKDETGDAAILIGEYNALPLPAFEHNDLITATVIPIKYLWKSIETKYKLMIALYTFRLPKRFIIWERLKPKGVYLLCLIKYNM